MKEKNLDSLRREVEQTFSRRILTSTDCQQLADEILVRTGKTLNSNTLRRCFGLVKSDYPPSLTTLHILSAYCGFSSFDELIEYKSRKDDDEIDVNKPLLNFLISIFKNIEVAQRDDSTYHALVRNVIYYFKQEPAIIYPFQKEIAKTRNGQQFYYEEFINVDKLADYYGEGLRYYLAEKKEPEGQILGNSLLALRAWLTVDGKGLEKHYKEVLQHPIHSSVHPFIQARHFATRIFYAAAFNQKVEEILLEAKEAFDTLKPSGDHYKGFPCFQLVMADALILSENYEEALFYATNGLSVTAGMNATVKKSQLFNSLLLYKAIACVQLGETERGKDLFSKIDPLDFYFLAKQYLSILYLLLSAKLNKTKGHEEQLNFLINETRFKKFADNKKPFFSKTGNLRVA